MVQVSMIVSIHLTCLDTRWNVAGLKSSEFVHVCMLVGIFQLRLAMVKLTTLGTAMIFKFV